MEKPPFPEVIDSTMRSVWVSCETKFKYAHLLHLRKSDSSPHLHFGACFAKGLEHSRKAFWQDGKSEDQSRLAGATAILEHWGDPFKIERHDRKSLTNCILAHDAYFNEYPLSTDSMRPHKIKDIYAIEMNFAVPIPNTRHPITGNPIIYAGRFDMLGDFNEATFVVDEKTATSLGASWRNNWRLRSQFTGYCWSSHQYDIPIQGAIIRGIGILKDKITFEQAIVARPQWQIDRWLVQLQKDIANAIHAWETDDYNLNLDSACAEYGGCPYLELCESQHPERWMSNYIVQAWEPLKVEAAA